MTGLAATVAELALENHHDVVLHALAVTCGAAAAGLSSEALAVAMFRARAAAWFRRGRAT